jgi:sugar (pentulose or hexulose) kinase
VVALQGGRPAIALLDYEHPIPPEVIENYQTLRDPFAITGSPRLTDDLNIGCQLFWLDRLYPEMREAVLVPWAQYWTWFFTRRAISEVTTLGWHSDLWAPYAGTFSPLAQRMGWASQFAPMVGADEVAGTVAPELAKSCGLKPQVKVLAGLHSFHAALNALRALPEIADTEATILSTGPMFIATRLPVADTAVTLPEDRDCLVSVDVRAKPLPSARFMGGREIEKVVKLHIRNIDIETDQPALLAAVPEVLRSSSMLLPTLTPGCGPFPDGNGHWLNLPQNWYCRRAATCLYVALVTERMLEILGAHSRLLVEGAFARAEVLLRALASLRPDIQIYRVSDPHNIGPDDVAFGALRLLDPDLVPQREVTAVEPLDADLATYRSSWLAEIGTNR